MTERKEWYTSDVEYLLKKLDHKCNTLYLARVLLVYSEVKKLMDLCEDYNNCKSSRTQQLIEAEMRSIVNELGHYKIYDDRFNEPFDKGGNGI